MEIAPPPLLVAVVRRIIPPDDREHVLGDLQERLQSSGRARPASQYLLDAMQTIPLVIWSRMRRLIAHPLFTMQAVMLFTGFLAAALGTPRVDGLTFLVTDQGLFRIGTPTLVAFFALLLADLYSRAEQRQPWNHLKCVAVALGAAWAVNGVTSTVAPAWSLPGSMMVRGMVFGFLAVSWVRFVFVFHGIERHLDVPVPNTLHALRGHVQRFEGGIHRRNRAAYVICLIVIAGFVWIAIMAMNLAQVIGAGLVVAAAMYLGYQVSLYRPAALPTDAEYDVTLRFYRDELARQRDFHQGNAFWLRLAVLVPGPLLVDVGFVLARPSSLRTVGAHAIVFITLAILAAALNRRMARRYDRQLRLTFGADMS